MARKMKDSGIEWIGEIPEEWKLTKTKYCYTNHKDVVGSSADEYERLALTLNGVIKRSKEDANGLQPESFSSYQILRTNELVFKLIDLQNVSTSRVGYSPYTGIVSPAYIILRPNENTESQYGAYYFLSMWQREVFNHIGDDGVRSSLNASDLLNISYLQIPLPEQRRIASFLDAKCALIDAAIDKTRASIEEYKKLKQAIITEAVTKGVRGKKRRMKDSGIEWIGEIPEEWETHLLKHSLKWKSEKGMPDAMVLSLYRDFGVIPKDSRDDNHNVTSLDTGSYKIVDKGDLVINKMKAWQGSLAISKYSGIVSPAYHVCTVVNDNLVIMYLHYLLRNQLYLPEYSRLSTGMRIGQWDLSFDDFKNLPFVLPSKDEQQEIVNYIDNKLQKIDSLINCKDHIISELETLKKSIIFEYVTGKKEVPA
ncbi:MAG: restriction endonuclease subunit S [Thermoguttaceae bacterium]|nr:restriction endonuclease subunit S [Thermoguttaceae bacterium]